MSCNKIPPDISTGDPHSNIPPFALMVAGLVSVAALYSLALPGYWLFDDWPNLFGLTHVEDFTSALVFILSGDAGPLGRPISLATFALQADAWDAHPEAMLLVNFAIHIAATTIVFVLATGLARLRDHQNALWIGAFAAALWGISPFLATTHLMVIQRMTSLSGLFVFLGLALFVWAHLFHSRRVSRAALLTGLGICTPLAVLSKENGALLPLLALFILITWIPRERRRYERVDRLIIGLLLAAPAFLLIAYLGVGFAETLLRGDYGTGRAFSPMERLLTQPVMLFDYLRHLLFPRPVAVTPFMDHIPASKGWLDPPITLMAALFWLFSISIAVAARRPAPWLFFGLGFFLMAHIMESSYIGLELYFAHRNYVPAFGIYFALVYSVLTLARRRHLVGVFSLAVYVLLMGFTLHQVTSHWNSTNINAELWVSHNPNSVRAYQLLARERAAALDFHGARDALDRASQAHPDHAQLQLQRTGICLGQEESFPDLLADAERVLRSTQRLQSAPALDLLKLAQQSAPSPLCPPRTHKELLRIARSLLENDVYTDRIGVRAQILLAKAFSYAALEDYESAVHSFKESYHAYPNLDVAFYALSLLANMGDYQMAYRFFEEISAHIPRGYFQRTLWEERLNSFRVILEESERIDLGG